MWLTTFCLQYNIEEGLRSTSPAALQVLDNKRAINLEATAGPGNREKTLIIHKA